MALRLLNDSSASGFKYLKMDSTGSVAWNVRLEKAGWYDIIFRYRTTQGDREEYIVRNGREIPSGFAYSENWNLFHRSTFLKEGENRIELKKSWGYIDIDYLKVTPAKVTPEISPKANIFYREKPNDISIKINRFGSQIKSVTCNGNEVPFTISDFPEFEDAVVLKIAKESVEELKAGVNIIKLNFDNSASQDFRLTVKEKISPAHLTIIAPDVEHGNSVLFILPTGKKLLVDCAKAWVRDEKLIPLLDRLNIKKIDYMFITHYHDDHASDDKGAKIIKRYNIDKFFDYKSFTTGETLDLEGVKIKILNCYNDGSEENSRSLSFRLEYNGFVYVHGADIYADNQKRILKDMPQDVKADVYFANHHFHGSVDVDYLRALDPKVVILQAEKAIYARSAYMDNFKEGVVHYLAENKKHFVEVLPALEIGDIVLRINGKDDWTYETYKETEKVIIPYL